MVFVPFCGYSSSCFSSRIEATTACELGCAGRAPHPSSSPLLGGVRWSAFKPGPPHRAHQDNSMSADWSNAVDSQDSFRRYRALCERLEDGAELPMFAPGQRPSSDQSRRQVRDDIAVRFSAERQTVVADDERLRGIVDDLVVSDDIGVLLGNLTKTVEEETIRELHDVGLVNSRDLLSAFALSVLECETRNPRRCFFGDDLEALDDARHNHVLEARVEVLCVLANDYEVNIPERSLDARKCLDRPEVGEETEAARA